MRLVSCVCVVRDREKEIKQRQKQREMVKKCVCICWGLLFCVNECVCVFILFMFSYLAVLSIFFHGLALRKSGAEENER